MRRLLPALLITAAAFAQTTTDWIDSPEAYFATSSERAEWFRLTSDAQREALQRRYWLMRDPTPNTEKNEFKEVILDRIRKADAKFSIKDGPKGSLTAQGQLYIVFGPPATIRTSFGGGVLRPGAFSANGSTVAEGTDTASIWIYDTHRTPRLLEMLGRPELQFTVVIEPTRRRDVLQAPGLFDEYRQVLARRSIVNPTANVVIAPPTTEITAARLHAPLPDSVHGILREAKPIARTAEGVVFSVSEVWMSGNTAAVALFTVPNAEDRTTHLTTYGEVRAGGQVAATIAQPFTTSDIVAAADGSRSQVLRLDLKPGAYDASFALVDDRTNKPLIAVATPLRVLDPAARFDVSSILLTGEPVQLTNAAFSFGRVAVQPRADLLFRSHESVWYFAVIRSASGAEGITADVQLRHESKTVAARTFIPRMDEIAAGFFLLGEELPLAQFPAGEYSLYVVVHAEGGTAEIRRADFRIAS